MGDQIAKLLIEITRKFDTCTQCSILSVDHDHFVLFCNEIVISARTIFVGFLSGRWGIKPLSQNYGDQCFTAKGCGIEGPPGYVFGSFSYWYFPLANNNLILFFLMNQTNKFHVIGKQFDNDWLNKTQEIPRCPSPLILFCPRYLMVLLFCHPSPCFGCVCSLRYVTGQKTSINTQVARQTKQTNKFKIRFLNIKIVLKFRPTFKQKRNP